MFWTGRMISNRLIITLGLFLIGALHTMIINFFQVPGNFLLGNETENLAFYCKIILYASAIAVSLSHQWLCKTIGLKKALYLGLWFNFFGLATLLLAHLLKTKGALPLIFLDMIFFGIALTSVINSLITYITLEFPKKTGAGITALFAAFNAGVMMAPILIDVFRRWEIQLLIYPFLMGLLLLGIWFVKSVFLDPKYPKHLEHLRKGTLIWQELHYRLVLYLSCIILYGIVESTFNLWGFLRIEDFLGRVNANETISFFWLFMIIGQIILLLPLYFFSAKRVFYLLQAMIMSALFLLPYQKTTGGFIAVLILGGFGCSAVFPILVSMIEKELLEFAKGSRLYPYFETACSVMIAGYFIGLATNDLWVEKTPNPSLGALSNHFLLAMLCLGGLIVVSIYLNLTSPKVSDLHK